jgi:hypothetical protein
MPDPNNPNPSQTPGQQQPPNQGGQPTPDKGGQQQPGQQTPPKR